MNASPSMLDQIDSAVLAAQSQQDKADNFASSIKKFIRSINSMPNIALSISFLCNSFKFQRRRFYDVINVLEALEFCQKNGVDELVWLGKSSFKKFLLKLKKSGRSDVYSHEQCISISSLTVKFIKSFFNFNMQKLNIKNLGSYLSQENGRIKTTTCKLYQISHILEASGVIEKTFIPGEIKLIDEYFNVKEVSQPMMPLTIEQLLNTPTHAKAPIDVTAGLNYNNLLAVNLTT